MKLTNIPERGSVSFEARANLSTNHIERAVDPVTAQPYFDVFYGNPPELFHDWPDFGDLTARYWETALMISDMIGKAPANTERLGELLMSYFSEEGLNYRPLTPYTRRTVELFDQSRTLSALCSAYMLLGDEKIADKMRGLIDGLISITVTEAGYRFFPGGIYVPGKDWEFAATLENAAHLGYFVGPLIRQIAKVWDVTGYQPAFDLAVDLARFIVEKAHAIGPNGELDAHIHSKLATAAGVFVCGKMTGNDEWCESARKAWKFCRGLSGPCGFVPEVLSEGDPTFRCETCTTMDYLDLTLLLALEGDDSKWGEAEKILRNHLIESQLTDTDWANPGESRPADEMSRNDNVGERMLGGYAGWSAHDRLFAIACRFDKGWLKGDTVDPAYYVGKRRLFQNCCGPAGTRAIYLAWSKAMVLNGNTLNVNLLVNRSTSAASVSVYEVEDNKIRLEITANIDCNLNVRIPEWTDSASLKPQKNGVECTFETSTYRLSVPGIKAGEKITVDYPYSLTTVQHRVNHLGDLGYEDFCITFKGDSAVSVKKTGGGMTPEQYADVCGLERNPPLYQRDPASVYAHEPGSRAVDAAIDWY